MSKNYTQLSWEQRYQIEAYLKVGKKQKEVAALIGVSPSTICRELSRNSSSKYDPFGRGYSASFAQCKTDLRHHHKPKKVLFDGRVKEKIVKRLIEDKWSPEFISRTAKSQGEIMVSHEWIYKWIWDCKHKIRKENRPYKNLYTHLRHGRHRRKRGKRTDNRGLAGTIKNRTPIEKRPAIVQKRKRIGDIEVDLMMGRGLRGAVLVMTDRATLHTRLKKLKGKESRHVAKTIVRTTRENNYPALTLTFDNDRAFSMHEQVAKELGASTYFTRPYTSQDKGTVENRIGVLRRFIPKRTDLTFVSQRDLNKIEKKINNRPIRKFNYLTANQVLERKIALIT